MFISELVDIGPFKIEKEPENLGQGKYRARLLMKDGSEKQITTYEGTIGNILKASGKGYCVAYFSEEISKTTGRPYINFKTAEA